MKSKWESIKNGLHRFVFGDDSSDVDEFVIIQTKDFQLKARFNDTLTRTRVTDFIVREYSLQGDFDAFESEDV